MTYTFEPTDEARELLKRAGKVVAAAAHAYAQGGRRSDDFTNDIELTYGIGTLWDDDEVWFRANWNDRGGYGRDTEHIRADFVPGRLENVLERMGIGTYWCDEYYTCDECYRLMRTEPDSYSWQPEYVAHEYGYTCIDCVDADMVIGLALNNPDYAIMRKIARKVDLDAAGFVQYDPYEGEETYHNGWHEGMTDNPREVAKRVQSEGWREYVFVLSETSQFYVSFECHVRDYDADADETLPRVVQALADAFYDAEGDGSTYGRDRVHEFLDAKPLAAGRLHELAAAERDKLAAAAEHEEEEDEEIFREWRAMGRVVHTVARVLMSDAY
jgi:hypothetical protein